MVTFPEVESWVNGFLEGFRSRGLGGNVVQDANAQLSGPEHAAWTGERFRLTVVGGPDDYQLELRGSAGDPVRIMQDPQRFGLLLFQFCCLES